MDRIGGNNSWREQAFRPRFVSTPSFTQSFPLRSIGGRVSRGTDSLGGTFPCRGSVCKLPPEKGNKGGRIARLFHRGTRGRCGTGAANARHETLRQVLPDSPADRATADEVGRGGQFGNQDAGGFWNRAQQCCRGATIFPANLAVDHSEAKFAVISSGRAGGCAPCSAASRPSRAGVGQSTILSTSFVQSSSAAARSAAYS
jgi:hypothetical protein